MRTEHTAQGIEGRDDDEKSLFSGTSKVKTALHMLKESKLGNRDDRVIRVQATYLLFLDH
jgi:hypothetical protein